MKNLNFIILSLIIVNSHGLKCMYEPWFLEQRLANKKLEHPEYDENVSRELFDAVQRGDIDTVRIILKSDKVDVNWQNTLRGEDGRIVSTGKTALMQAVIGNHFEIVEMLMNDPRTKPGVTEEEGITAHMYSIVGIRGDLNIIYSTMPSGIDDKIALLLINHASDDNKCALSQVDDNGRKILAYAILHNKIEICKALLKKDPHSFYEVLVAAYPITWDQESHFVSADKYIKGLLKKGIKISQEIIDLVKKVKNQAKKNKNKK